MGQYLSTEQLSTRSFILFGAVTNTTINTSITNPNRHPIYEQISIHSQLLISKYQNSPLNSFANDRQQQFAKMSNMGDLNNTMNNAMNSASKAVVNLSIGLIAGIAAGGAVILIIIAVSIYCCVKKCRAKNIILQNGNTPTYIQANPVPMQGSVINTGARPGYSGAPQMPFSPNALAENIAHSGNTPLLGVSNNPYGGYGNTML